jgi:catabolite regulation protein CreA
MKKLLRKISHFFAGRKIKKDLLNRRVHRETVTFEEAKNIGVLFSAHTEEDIKTALNYIADLKSKSKTVEYIGYIAIKDYKKNHKNEEKDPHYIFDSDFDFFHRPKKELIEKFYKQQFDLLISLNYTNQFSINYISSLSAARLRVGKFSMNNVNAYDFMIDDKAENMSTFIQALNHYLNIIKK